MQERQKACRWILHSVQNDKVVDGATSLNGKGIGNFPINAKKAKGVKMSA
jgi:hypothetical protein